MQGENMEFNAWGDIGRTSATHKTLPCLANWAARRHIILKERLTAATDPRPGHGSAQRRSRARRAEIRCHMAYSRLIRPQLPDVPCFVHDTVFDDPAHWTPFARAFAPPHDSARAGMRSSGERDCGGRLFALADLGSGCFKQPGTV